MRPTFMQRSAFLAALVLCAGPVACDSLTTPDEQRVQLELLIEVENGVDPADIQTGSTLDLVAKLITDGGAAVVADSQIWASASQETLQVLVPRNGTFIAQKVGHDTALVEVVVETDFGREVILRGAQAVRVQGELFNGSIDPTTVLFGDTITIDAPSAQSGQWFSATTRVLFTPDKSVTSDPWIAGFVVSRTDSTSLRAIVPAGIDKGRITLTGMRPDDRTIDSEGEINRHASDDDLDVYEEGGGNNNEGNSEGIVVPFGETVLSVHADADRDFFTFQPGSSQTVTITLNWNVDANLNFEVYHYVIVGLCPLCSEEKRTDHHAQSSDNRSEQATVTLQGGEEYFLRIYAAGSLVAPTTYLLSIE